MHATMASINPIVIELSKPEIMNDSEKQLKLLKCAKIQLNNKLLDVKEVISPLVKLVASNNSLVKVILIGQTFTFTKESNSFSFSHELSRTYFKIHIVKV